MVILHLKLSNVNFQLTMPEIKGQPVIENGLWKDGCLYEKDVTDTTEPKEGKEERKLFALCQLITKAHV